MKLYNSSRSSASFRVRIALNLKGLDYEYVAIQLAKGEHLEPEYTSVAAHRLVPLVEVGHERLSQSLALMEYLDEIQPEPALLPRDPMRRAHVRALALSLACEVHPLNNLRVLRYLSQNLHLDEESKARWCQHWVRDGLESFERQLAKSPASPFCHGDEPTIADCCLVPQIFSAQRFKVSFEGLGRTMAAFNACMKLDAFQKAQPSACPDFVP